MQNSIEINILASEYWKSGQCIAKISEEEFWNFSINKRKRLMKRAPEYWIFINTGTKEQISPGKYVLFIFGDHTGKNYNLEPVDPSPSPPLLDANVTEIKQFSPIPIENMDKITFLLSELITTINTVTNYRLECPPHLFKCIPSLNVIFCEKCGKTKPV
jgi:hypothetical protein